jgi:hypothetical protein
MFEPKVLTFKLKLRILKIFFLKFKILLGLKINLFQLKDENLFIILN